MTELEKYIYEAAKPTIERALEKINSGEVAFDCRYIDFPFQCDGVIDTVQYDNEKGRFTSISYQKGVGEGVVYESLMPETSAAYFDDVVHCEFDIPER